MSKKKHRPEDLVVVKWMQKVTTLHGSNHFNTETNQKLVLWCIIMLSNVILTAAFIMVIRNKFNESQIVTRINADCKISQVPFPAISICNMNMVSMRESTNIVNLLKSSNIRQTEIEDFINALPLLKVYDKNSVNVGNFTNIISILKSHYFTVESIMEEVQQNCDALLVYCSFNRKQKKCDNLFRLTKTYEGHCCVFNYFALNDPSDVFFITPDEDLEYYYDQNERDSLGGNIITTPESGSNTGLRVVINVEPNDYPKWSSLPYYGAKILLTDPNDYPETTVIYRYLSLGESMDIKVEAMLLQSEDNIRRVDPEKRGCWFFDEVPLEHTDRYSFETCTTECKMQTYMSMCGCIPYKYPVSKEKSSKICEFEDLKCLHNVTVYKSINEMDCKPVCYVECRDKTYEVTSDLVPFLGMGIPENITQSYNISQLAELKVYYARSNINCYKLTLLTDEIYFIATYGGIFSLTFGGSVQTVLELIFIFLTSIYRKFKIYVN